MSTATAPIHIRVAARTYTAIDGAETPSYSKYVLLIQISALPPIEPIVAVIRLKGRQIGFFWFKFKDLFGRI
jgi:hypothetical protein